MPTTLKRLRPIARTVYHYLLPQVVFRRYLEDHSGDEIEMQFLEALVDPKRDAVDVGANLGRYSARLAKLAKNVHAFEPHPRLSYILRRSLPTNVSIRQAAVSDRDGSVKLNVPLLNNEQQVESRATLEIYSDQGPTETITVPTVQLDSLGIRDIGFIKIDVEGHEESVLRGALNLITSATPNILIEIDCHHNNGTTDVIFALLESLEYDGVFWFDNRFLDIDQFDSKAMQDERELRGKARRDARYVNNFIFAHRTVMSSLKERLTKIALTFNDGATNN